MSKVEELIKQERANLKKATFSKTTFVKLMATYINEPEFKSHVMKINAGEETAEVLDDYPVKKFRKMIKNVLTDFGVDAADAEKIMSEYKFKEKDMENMYDFMSDFIYQYLKTGRKFKIFDKVDMNAAIIAKDVKADAKEYEANEKRAFSRVEWNDYKKVKVQSSCPEWEKTRKNKEGKVTKAMKKVFGEK